MKFLILFNNAYNGLTTYDISFSKNIVNMIEENSRPSEIIVCIGPSQYTACRRAIAIASGWAYESTTKVYGFNIINDFMKFDKCFFAYGKLIWVKDGNNVSMVNMANKSVNLCDYYGNINLDGNKVIDCGIHEVWKRIDELKFDLQQEYYDKFNEFM